MAVISPALTDYGRTLQLNVLFGLSASPPGQLYMGLSRTAPLIDGSNFTELSGLNYARVAMPTWSVPVIGVPAVPGGTGRTCYTNPTADITFPNPSGAWNTIPDGLHAGLFDASAGGNLIWLMPGIISTLQHPSHDHPLHIPAFDGGGNPQAWIALDVDGTLTDLQSRYTTGPFSGDYPASMDKYRFPDSYIKGVLDRLTGRSAAWTAPTYYAGLWMNTNNCEPNQAHFLMSAANYGSGLDTWAGDPSYARAAVSWNTVVQNFGFSDISSSNTWSWTIGISAPGNPTPGTTDWDRNDVRDYQVALWDASSGGNKIIQIAKTTSVWPPSPTNMGDVIRIPAGNITYRAS